MDKKGCSGSSASFLKLLFISQMVPVFGSRIIMSFPTLIAVQRAREHPVSNKRQMIKPDAICNTVALQIKKRKQKKNNNVQP